MSTKVKGDKIKEGSIPLNAMDDDFRFGYSTCPRENHNLIQTIDLTNFKVEDTFTINKNVADFYIGLKQVTPSDVRYDEVHIKTYGTYSIPYKGPNLTVNISPGNSSTIMKIISGTNTGANCIVEVYTKDINKLDKKFLPDDIGGADWNAAEGEAGYIENKPFEKIIFDGIIESDNTIVYDYNISTSAIYISCENKEILHFINAGGNEEATLDWPNIKISWNGMDNVTITNLSDESIDAIKGYISIYAYEYNIRLPSSSIDDGVIKTFPQTLSYTDKNQALANLGIDPVVWKYICNPFIIYTEQDNPVPDDLLSIIDDNGSLSLNPIVLKLIVVKYSSEWVWSISKVEPSGVYYSDDSKFEYSNGTFIWS